MSRSLRTTNDFETISDEPRALASMGERFLGFCDRFAGHFHSRTRQVVTQSRQYLCGLMQTPRKNMERMAEVVPESDEQSLQHFAVRIRVERTSGA